MTSLYNLIYLKQGKSSKSRLKRKMELDRISNLPSEVIDQILSCLTLKEAVKTSVLSSNWRYKAAMLPHLVFDSQCLSTQNKTSFVSIVDRVLLLHIGPIHTFKIFHQRDPVTSSDIGRWILHLSRNPIKEFVFEDWTRGPHKMPSCLFSFQDLLSLDVRNCLLNPPSTFKGFRSLKSLYLHAVNIAQDMLENLIVRCPLLERLTFSFCDGFTHLKIDAPNLKCFESDDTFVHFNFENTLNLVEVHIYLGDIEFAWDPDSSSYLAMFFVHLPHIRRLQIRGYFLQSLADGPLSRKLPKPCLYLNFLSITIFFGRLEEVSAAQCLLRSCPALQELEIVAHNDYDAVVQEGNLLLDDNQNRPFNQLRLVKITDISGSKYELDFIRCLLLTSPVLERMIVEPGSVNDFSKLVKELLQFRRASSHAEIIYLGP